MKIIFILFVILPLSCFSQNWVEAVKNDRQLIEVDFSSIKRTEKSVSFWERTSYQQKDIDYYIDKQIKIVERYNYKLKREDFKNWKYTMAYSTHYCNQEKYSVSTIILYRSNGTIIYRIDTPDKEIEKVNIAPNSLMWGIHVYFCNTYKFILNNKTFNLFIEEIEEFLEKHPRAKHVE